MPGYEMVEIPEGLRDAYNATGSDIADKLGVRVDPADPGSFPTKVSLLSATTDPVFGFVRGILKNGQVGSVATRGRLIAKAGGSVTRGQRVTVGTNGKVTTAAPAGGTNTNMAGTALTSAANDEDILLEVPGPGVMFQG